MELLDEEGIVWTIAVFAVALALTVALYLGGVVNSKTPVALYHNVVSGAVRAAKEADAVKLYQSVDYNCGDYGHSTTLAETIDYDDPFGVQNARKRLDRRMNIEIAKLKKQGCQTIIVH